MTIDQLRITYIILGFIGLCLGGPLFWLNLQTITRAKRRLQRIVAWLFLVKDLGIMFLLGANAFVSWWLLATEVDHMVMLPAYIMGLAMAVFDLFILGMLWVSLQMTYERRDHESVRDVARREQ